MKKKCKTILKYIFSIFFILAGVNHFLSPDWYVKMMPPYLPWHRELVYVSGVTEIGLGAMLIIPKLQRLASWGLIALLLAVFPANIHMAMNTELFPDISPQALYLRLPVQGILILWAYWYTIADSKDTQQSKIAA